MAKMIDTKCGWCGARVYDYASNRRPTKSGHYYCSPQCAGKGRAYYVSVALGGEKLEDPSEFKHGKSNRDRVYYRKNAEKVRERVRGYYEKNRGDVISRRKQKDRKLKKEVIEAYGGACECCGETMIEFLTIDHIHNDGAEHRARVGKGRGIYQDIKKRGFPGGKYRVLCFNCNIARGFYGYCPHHPEEYAPSDKTPGKYGAKVGRPIEIGRV